MQDGDLPSVPTVSETAKEAGRKHPDGRSKFLHMNVLPVLKFGLHLAIIYRVSYL